MQIDQVMAKYATAATALSQAQQAAANDVSAARSALQASYDAQAAAIQKTIDAYSQLSSSLKSYGQQLASEAAAGAATPQQALAQARTAFEDLAARAKTGDQAAMSQLQSAGQAFLQAAQAGAPNQLAYAAALAEVRAAVVQAGQAADAQVSAAQAQLAAIDAQVQGLLDLNKNVLSLSEAMTGLTAALGVQSNLTSAQYGVAINDNAFDVAKYLADNPDLTANWDADGIMRQLGPNLAAAALAHYEQTGKSEIAKGLRKFADGGSFTVPGSGPIDSKIQAIVDSPGEVVSVSHGDNMGRMADQLERMEARLDAGLAAIARNTGAMARLQKRWDGDGLPAARGY